MRYREQGCSYPTWHPRARVVFVGVIKRAGGPTTTKPTTQLVFPKSYEKWRLYTSFMSYLRQIIYLLGKIDATWRLKKFCLRRY